MLFGPVVCLGKKTLPKGVLMPDETWGPFGEFCWVDRYLEQKKSSAVSQVLPGHPDPSQHQSNPSLPGLWG